MASTYFCCFLTSLFLLIFTYIESSKQCFSAKHFHTKNLEGMRNIYPINSNTKDNLDYRKKLNTTKEVLPLPKWDRNLKRRSNGYEVNSFENRNISVVVTTSSGLKSLDRSITLNMPGSATIYDLKTKIEEEFPGHPPVHLQTLLLSMKPIDAYDHKSLISFINTSKLNSQDSHLILPIVLDMFTVPIGNSISEHNNDNNSTTLQNFLTNLLLLEKLLIFTTHPPLSPHSQHPDYPQNQNPIYSITFKPNSYQEISKSLNDLSQFININNLTHIVLEQIANIFEPQINVTIPKNNTNIEMTELIFNRSYIIEPSYDLSSRLSDYFFIFLNIQWKQSFKLAALLIYLTHFNVEMMKLKSPLELSLPLLLISQLRPFRLLFKFFRNSVPKSELWKGFNIILSSTNQELLINRIQN